MKVFVVAILTWVGFLLAQPTISQIYHLLKVDQCCEEQCCNSADEKCPDTPPSNDCCPYGVCNPICPCCNFITTEKTTLQDERISAENLFFPLSENAVSNYCSDCFRPPEIV